MYLHFKTQETENEMLLDSGRHVLAGLGVFALNMAGHASRALGHVIAQLAGLLASLYDVYIAVPLRIEAMVRGESAETARGRGAKPRRRELSGESLA